MSKMAFQDSELILNPDGSIYHLHLQPEQIADTIFLVGDQDRVPLVSRHFDRMEHQVRKREFVTHTGWLGERRLSVVSTGIGPDNIDIVLNELDALANIDLARRQARATPVRLRLIRLGTSGALQSDIPVDSLVVSAAGIGLDGLLHFYQAPEYWENPAITALREHFGAEWTFPLSPYIADGSQTLLNILRDLGPSGYTATNPGFYGPQGRQLRAPVRYRGYLDLLSTFEYGDKRVMNLEMETSAIFGLAGLLGHDAISVNAIIANRPLGRFSTEPGKVIQHMIASVLDKI